MSAATLTLMADERPPIELTDPRALRAYAHPVRGKLVGLLRRRGPLTATQAGAALGESSGTTSFHLRQLAKYGLVEPAPGGKGREKPWQATSMLTHVPPIFSQSEATEAAKQLKIAWAERYFDGVVQWLQRSEDETEEWQRAAQFGDRILYATAEELAALDAAIEELMEPYGRRLAHVDERPPDAREVLYIGLAFPMEPP
jgi:predicted ArsR family transcriptional regulator